MFPRDSLQPVETLTSVLDRARAQNDPTAPALSFYRGDARTTTLTYAEYLDRIDAWAAFLQAQGVRRGDRVATLLRNRADVPVLYLAAMSVGGIVVPLNPSYSLAEIQHVLGETEPLLVVTDEATYGGRPAELGHRAVLLDSVKLELGTRPADAGVEGDDAAVILYTSGTTAVPKGVVQMHRNLVANAWSMVKALGIDHPVQYSVMPFYHAHAVGFGMMTCLLSSGHLVMTERMDPRMWSRVVAGERVTVTSMVPSMLQLLVRARVTGDDVPTLKWIFVSAAPLPSALARQFEDQSGLRIAHAWGLSEFTNFATVLPAQIEGTLRAPLMFGQDTPCVGRALDGVDVEVVRADDSEADPGELGELRVRGPSRTKGYYRQPEATASVFRGDWVYSGDQGHYAVAGSSKYFFITGRIKDIIIRSGENISPVAIEAAIEAEVPELAGRIVALGYPHEVYGEEVGLVVEIDELRTLEDRLRTALTRVPARIRPKIVLWGDGIIPRTHTGKTQRRMLVRHFEAYSTPAASGTIARVGRAAVAEAR
jgi:long-chain acyl-CoA synthetase